MKCSCVKNKTKNKTKTKKKRQLNRSMGCPGDFRLDRFKAEECVYLTYFWLVCSLVCGVIMPCLASERDPLVPRPTE